MPIFRSTALARFFASTVFIVLCTIVSMCSGAHSLTHFGCGEGVSVHMVLTVAVFLVNAANTKPIWSPTLRYPAGWIVGPLAALLLLTLLLGEFAVGGSPIRRMTDGIAYYAADHGALTSLSANAFWFLVALEAAAWNAALLHVLLENRWRYKRDVELVTSAEGEVERRECVRHL